MPANVDFTNGTYPYALRIGSDGTAGLFLGFFLLFILYMALGSILAIKTPDAIGRSFKKEE